MPTQHEIVRSVFDAADGAAQTPAQVFALRASVRERCDAAGVKLTRSPADEAVLERARSRAKTTEDIAAIAAAEMNLDAAVSSVLPSHLLDATPRQDGLEHGEHLVSGNACDCSESVCKCRALGPGPHRRGDSNQVRSDAGVLPTEPANPDALMFGEINLDKARAILGDARFAELKEADEREWTLQNAVARSNSSAGVYRGVLVGAISQTCPDLADRAATESMAWLRSQYAAIPDPNDETEESENTDMANQDDGEARVAEARRRMNQEAYRASHEPTDAVRRLDKLAADEGEEDEGDDEEDADEPTGNAHERAMKTLDKLRAKAHAGTLDPADARRMARLAAGIAAMNSESGPVEKADAAEFEGSVDDARDALNQRSRDAWRQPLSDHPLDTPTAPDAVAEHNAKVASRRMQHHKQNVADYQAAKRRSAG